MVEICRGDDGQGCRIPHAECICAGHPGLAGEAGSHSALPGFQSVGGAGERPVPPAKDPEPQLYIDIPRQIISTLHHPWTGDKYIRLSDLLLVLAKAEAETTAPNAGLAFRLLRQGLEDMT